MDHSRLKRSCKVVDGSNYDARDDSPQINNMTEELHVGQRGGMS